MKNNFVRFYDILINIDKLVWVGIIMEQNIYGLSFRFDNSSLDFAINYRDRYETEKVLAYFHTLIK